jgi:hypothetical protein
MGVSIATQQQHLKKQDTGGPDRRAPAEPGENGLADDRLDLEQQKCAREDGHRRPPGHCCATLCFHNLILPKEIGDVPSLL